MAKNGEYYSLGSCFVQNSKHKPAEHIDDILREIDSVIAEVQDLLAKKIAERPIAPSVHDQDAYFIYMDKLQKWVGERDALSTKLIIAKGDRVKAERVKRLGPILANKLVG